VVVAFEAFKRRELGVDRRGVTQSLPEFLDEIAGRGLDGDPLPT